MLDLISDLFWGVVYVFLAIIFGTVMLGTIFGF